MNCICLQQHGLIYKKHDKETLKEIDEEFKEIDELLSKECKTYDPCFVLARSNSLDLVLMTASNH